MLLIQGRNVKCEESGSESRSRRGGIKGQNFRLDLITNDGGIFEHLGEDGSIDGASGAVEKLLSLDIIAVFQGNADLAENPIGIVDAGAVFLKILDFPDGLLLAIQLDKKEEAFIGYEDVSGVQVACAVKVLQSGFVLADCAIERGASIEKGDVRGGGDAAGVEIKSGIVVFFGFLKKAGDHPG